MTTPTDYILIENAEVYGFRHALRNMRNPKESWSRSDSSFDCGYYLNKYGVLVPENPQIGPEDLKLFCALAKGGNEHRKVLRTIHIQIDVCPWRGMWQEVDTYKIAVTRNSCSTMHKLGHRDLTPDDFQDRDVELDYLQKLNDLGKRYRESGCKDKAVLMKLKHRLPEGFIQRAGLDFNYENALNMFSQRENHNVPQWRWSGPLSEPDFSESTNGKWPSFCDFLWHLPYMKNLIDAITEIRQ